MVFSNAVFLFLFLPIVLLGYYLLRGKVRNYWLLLVSLVFYAWNKPSFLWILLASIVTNYVGALLVERTEKKRRKLALLWVTVGINLGLLFYFKYFNFTMSIVESLLKRNVNFTEVILPIGISFFTFQGLSYVVDVYRGEVPAQRNPFKLGMYISLFPQLVAGPIVRYQDVAKEIDNRQVGLEDFSEGCRRFIIGMFKKIILADSLALTADTIFGFSPSTTAPAVAWIGIIAYSLQLFLDFSGYSDMAIGLGRMFGFHFLENFNYPYISKSITEFWRRWHMSLSTFFRDYVYIPLGGNRRHVYLNVAIVFLLTGIWHGAAYTFIIWGIWHGIFNMSERVFRSGKKGDRPARSLLARTAGAGLSHSYTLLVVIIGWVFFRSPDLAYAIGYIGAMFGFGGSAATCAYLPAYFLDKWTVTVLILSLLIATPLPRNVLRSLQEKLPAGLCSITRDLVLLLTMVLCLLQVVSSTYSAFIYFQF